MTTTDPPDGSDPQFTPAAEADRPGQGQASPADAEHAAGDEQPGGAAEQPGGADEQPGGADEQPAEVAAAPRTRVGRSVTLGAVAVVVALGLVVASAVVLGKTVVPRLFGVEYAKVGQCLAETASGYRKVACTDHAAEYQVTAVTRDTAACIDVPGTTATYARDGRVLCIGAAHRDPATTINGITVGECVVFKGDDPYRSGCDVTGAAEVLLVLKDVPKDLTGGTKVVQRCLDEGAADTDTAYAWGIFRAGMGQLGNWDRVLCLGPEKS